MPSEIIRGLIFQAYQEEIAANEVEIHGDEAELLVRN